MMLERTSKNIDALRANDDLCIDVPRGFNNQFI